MFVIGIILILLAAVVFGYLWFGTQGLPALDLDLGVFQVSLTPLVLYLLGAATLVVFVGGLMLLIAGARAQARRRREVKQLRQQVQSRPAGNTPSRELPAEGEAARGSGRDAPYEREVDPQTGSGPRTSPSPYAERMDPDRSHRDGPGR